jgi:uncharacterized protein YycO
MKNAAFPANIVSRLGVAMLILALSFNAEANKLISIATFTGQQSECLGHTKQRHSTQVANDAEVLKDEISAYQILAEQALTYRYETIATGKALKEKASKNLPLTGKDLDRLNAGTIAHLELREQLMQLATLHECWLDFNNRDLARHGLTQLGQLKGIMVSLSSALILYDNYLLSISLFEEDEKLRRLINKSDLGYKLRQSELAKITLSYNSIDNRRRVRRAIHFYEKHIAQYRPGFDSDPAMKYLDLLIQQSPSYEMTKSYSPLFVLGKKLEFFGAITSDTLYNISSEGINIFSMLFGNTVGLIESRHGKLYGQQESLTAINSNLQAGDILLEKTPFRLTDSFIPGHWGHAALWIGTEQELRQLDIWDHELVRKHHDTIRKGHRIVEALRSGVQMSSLEEFSNVDDLVILRAPDISKQDQATTILQALRQIGKSYDYNFDVETTDRIVCSELIYLTYTNINWPTDKTLGRTTISPDNIASKSLKGTPLKIVMLFHDGQLVSSDSTSKMKRLMGL